MTDIEPTRTERLILREFTLEDWQAVHQYGSDPLVMRGLLLPPNTVDMSREVVEQFVSYQSAKPRTQIELAITMATTGALIGAGGVRINLAAQPGSFNGLCIGARLLGTGIRYRGSSRDPQDRIRDSGRPSSDWNRRHGEYRQHKGVRETRHDQRRYAQTELLVTTSRCLAGYIPLCHS